MQHKKLPINCNDESCTWNKLARSHYYYDLGSNRQPILPIRILTSRFSLRHGRVAFIVNSVMQNGISTQQQIGEARSLDNRNRTNTNNWLLVYYFIVHEIVLFSTNFGHFRVPSTSLCFASSKSTNQGLCLKSS